VDSVNKLAWHFYFFFGMQLAFNTGVVGLDKSLVDLAVDNLQSISLTPDTPKDC
jgi:hypothetical protein